MDSKVFLLRLIDLPVFSSIDELAELIHIALGILKKYSEQPNSSYVSFFIPKSDGGSRLIRSPVRELKGIQAWILRNILDKLSISPYATAYTKGRNISDNVEPHRNNRFYIIIDLEDFFPSISTRRVIKLFLQLGYSKPAADILAQLCTFDGNLPQGAVTSPAISNIIASKLDRRIAGYCSKRNITFTRYADDITLSSNNRDLLNQSLSRIINIIKTEHFRINIGKLRILGPRRRVAITGLIKNNSDPKFGIGRFKRRRMRAVIHNHLIKNGADVEYTTGVSILGWMAYLKSVDKDSYIRLYEYYLKLKEASAS